MYHIEILIAPNVNAYNFNLWKGMPFDLPTKSANLQAEDCRFAINEVVLNTVDRTIVECRLTGTVEVHPSVVIGDEQELISKAIAKLTDDWKITTEYNIMGQQDLLSSFKIIRE